MRDRADEFDRLGAVVIGASFDTPAENRAFADAQEFGFPLLSDTDRAAATAYGVVRPAGDAYADYPIRASFLIDPAGSVHRVYDVGEVGTHADLVLADLTSACEGSPTDLPG